MKKTLFILAALVGSFIVSIFFAELGLRLFLPQQETMRWYQPSADYKYRLRENFSQDYKYTGHDFVMRVETNSHGHRQNETNLSADYDLRVLILGDSFTFGLGVQLEDRFDEVLSRRLQQEGENVLWINTGIPGWGTIQQTRYGLDHLAMFNPDLILLIFYQNDPRDDDLFLNYEPIRIPGKLFLRDHSHLYRFLFYSYQRYKKLNTEQQAPKKAAPKQGEQHPTKTAYKIPTDKWERTKATIREFHAAYMAHNPSGKLVIFSATPWLEEHNVVLNELDNGDNLRIFNPMPAIAHIPDDDRSMPHDGHWSVALNAAFADALYPLIRKELKD